MQPSFSIIFFTTASGAGFALLFLLGLGAPLGWLPNGGWFAFTGLALAMALAVGGLGSSVLHLGRPERAWRAFSQWRSSWLSREGVLAVATFLPTLVFAIGWVFFAATRGVVGLCGIVAAALAVATICCTGMIYASLKPIRQWCNHWVLPGYLTLALMSGLLLLDLLVRLWGRQATALSLAALAGIAIAWWIKERYWRFIDTTSGRSTAASATSLGSRGRVRPLESPHTEANYLLQEMGFEIGRKHARRLRWISRLTGFLLPAVCTVLGLGLAGVAGAAAAALAVFAAAIGLIIERWLFFAEAEHTVVLYYAGDGLSA